MRRVIIFGFIISCILGGCSEDFLTTVPKDRLSSATFWTSERDFNVALNGAYAEIKFLEFFRLSQSDTSWLPVPPLNLFAALARFSKDSGCT